MAQLKILLDTNSYFRLAKSVHPLLGEPFGDENYCLYVLPEVDLELRRQPRLQSKFPWAGDEEFAEPRRKKPGMSRPQARERKVVYDFLWDHVQNELPGPSPVDCTVLSYASVLGIEVVTDDKDMRELADAFGIATLSTLQLVKRMLDCGHIGMGEVRRIAAYWSYQDDRPRNYAKDYRRLFGEEAPP
ncbi:MAG: DNA-binding protein [Gammaproteobacteria bacterium]